MIALIKQVLSINILKISNCVIIAGGHKLFDEVNKPPSSPTPLFIGVKGFCRGVPMRGHKKKWAEEYFA